MTSAATVTRFASVDSNPGPGARIRARRKSLGMAAGRLSSMAQVSREHLSAVENGHKSPTEEWVRRVELAMDQYERETGQDEPTPTPTSATGAAAPLRFVFHDVLGIGEIIAEGPVDHPEELVAAIRELLAELRTTPKD